MMGRPSTSSGYWMVAGLATLIALINHRFRLVPEVEDVGRRSIGTIAYGLSITVLVW